MKRTFFLIIVTLLISSCDFLDREVRNKVSSEVLYSDENGILAYLASLYQQLPVEDFNFKIRNGQFNVFKAGEHLGEYPMIATPYAVSSRGYSIMYNKGGAENTYWEPAFELIRDINILEESVPMIKDEVLSPEQKKSLIGEAAFLRAYTYFALAKRYGGVPLITKNPEYDGSDISNLMLTRATERETYDFILAQCDTAAKYLVPAHERRATRWAALALKSRVALHAASICKYPVHGSSQAVSEELIACMHTYDGLADVYYRTCIEASLQVMSPEAGFSLYMPQPASAEEVVKNYQKLFESPSDADMEVIFMKGWCIPQMGTAHNWDLQMCTPQAASGYKNGGTVNPTLDMVDLYETYDSMGESVPVNTRFDGDLSYSSFSRNTQMQYIHFDDPQEIFAGKDARLFATIITPFSEWKGQEIVIQKGLVKPDGSFLYGTDGSVTANGKTYYAYGAESSSSYSGYGNDSQHSHTGFFVRKSVVEANDPLPAAGSVTTDFIEMRYPEVLLNFAEAVIESGYTENNAQQLATDAVNSIRRRAGHTYELPSPVTLEQIKRERRVEFAMEGSLVLWDMIRLREYAGAYKGFKHKVLCPMLDLTVNPPQYFYVRDNHAKQVNAMNWTGAELTNYYLEIPGTGTNGLIPNK